MRKFAHWHQQLCFIKKRKEFAQVKESHNEAKAYYDFFNDLKYHKVSIITDD